LAFCRDQELGVDVERGSMRRSRSAHELATRFFASDEALALAGLPDTQRERAFLHLWTCKEAVLKAIGHGLSFGLDRLRFALDDNGEPHALVSIADEAGSASEWQIHRFDPGSGHVGSLAWRGTPRTIRTFLLQPTATAD
ncbi:MAG: 4'-phosphopantetheinyl transferase superfamily protein, partial [Dokdonella sp.]